MCTAVGGWPQPGQSLGVATEELPNLPGAEMRFKDVGLVGCLVSSKCSDKKVLYTPKDIYCNEIS